MPAQNSFGSARHSLMTCSHQLLVPQLFEQGWTIWNRIFQDQRPPSKRQSPKERVTRLQLPELIRKMRSIMTCKSMRKVLFHCPLTSKTLLPSVCMPLMELSSIDKSEPIPDSSTLDRYIVDYLIRKGRLNSATALATSQGIEVRYIFRSYTVVSLTSK